VDITAWMKKEVSGLAVTTLELVEATEKHGHQVCLRQPGDGMPIYHPNDHVDLHSIHSQINPSAYFDDRPKVLWLHGEALSSVGNGISAKAIVDLAPMCSAFLAMRREELSIWRDVCPTYYVGKGVDLERYIPADGPIERLSGEPAVLYCENWRGQRNPLYIILAMREVFKKYPKARLHLYNCTDKRMYETFKALVDHCKYGMFVRSLQGAVADVPALMARVDIVVSALHPLYARTPLEALACGKAAICAGYNEPGYPWTVKDYSPEGFAETIIACWEKYDHLNYRAYAEAHHDVGACVAEAIRVYERFV
jgi:glycosyltransferase involved in cell wall biosynthesis